MAKKPDFLKRAGAKFVSSVALTSAQIVRTMALERLHSA